MDVGVRELRARLSELLDRAAAGDLIRVTHRGRPKALLVPPSAQKLLEPRRGELTTDARIEQGIREGWIRPARGHGLPKIPPRGFPGKISTEEALREDRDDEE